jgi:hypothetical protein
MEAKIITKEEAVKIGLTKESQPFTGRGQTEYVYGIVGGYKPDGTKDRENIKEFTRTHIKTGVTEIIYEHPNYKKEKKDLKINEYKVDGHK